jgi:hypothetical protein
VEFSWAWTAAKPSAYTSLIKHNQLNQNGCICSFRNDEPYPESVGSKLPCGDKDEWTQFTYHFRPSRPGTFMYCSQSVAPEHMQMGIYGALVIRPVDYVTEKKTAYGQETDTDYDLEYTFILSEFDPLWHRFIEGDLSILEFELAKRKLKLWFLNGRSFPQTLLPFAWNKIGGNAEPGARYNTRIEVALKQKLLIRPHPEPWGKKNMWIFDSYYKGSGDVGQRE